MKRSLLFIFSMLGFVLMSAETEKIRIMTYNIPMGNIPAVGLNTWANRCIGLQEYINRVHPDLLGLQEPVRTELMNLLSGMPGYSMLGQARDNGYESGEYSPILYNTKRLIVEKSGTYWLSKTPDVVSKNWNSACNRVATWAVFRDKVTQARFLYTNTHLDHKSDSARENQMKVIKVQMRKIIQENGTMPMMLTGDFNVTQDKSTYTNASSYLITMRDAWLTAKEKSGSGNTFPSSEEISTSTPRKIDYIMLSTDITTLAAHTEESALPSGQILSDHNPHWADICWATTDEEDFRAIYQQGKQAMDSTVVYSKGNTKLITNATDGDSGCQITHDGAEPTEGNEVKSLIDGNTATYFHSLWSKMPPANPHYLQVDMKQDVRAIHFTYQRRDHDTFGPADRWEEVMITASNDSKNWDYITQLYNFSGDDMAVYTSPVINLHKPYRYVRFNVMHTPAMKIRNSNPQFTCSEFMVYLDVLQTTQSQYSYNDELKVAVDELATLDVIVGEALRDGSLTEEQKQAYLRALSKVRSVFVDYVPLEKAVARAQELYTTFTAGTKYGQVDKTIRNQLRTIYTKVKSAMTSPITHQEADSLMNVITEAINTFISARRTFETDKWYYIQNHQLTASNVKGKMFGQALYAAGDGSSAKLRAGYYASSKLTCPQNPYAMWRILKVDQGYALQNRATGMFLGRQDSDASCYKMSALPVTYDVEMFGVEDFHFSVSGDNGAYLTALSDGEVGPSDQGFRTAASWLFTDVDDATIQTMKLPVLNHTIMIKTLPYAYENLNEADGIHTYTLVDALSSNVFALKKKKMFAAGEPFFMLTGEICDLNSAGTDTIYFDVKLPSEYVTAPLSVNGLYGTLDDTRMHKIGYFLQLGKLRMGNAVQPANTGYIVKADVANLSDTYDATLSYSQGVLGIQPVADRNNNMVDVYTIDGKIVLRQVSSLALPTLLPAGIYIVGGQKIAIK